MNRMKKTMFIIGVSFVSFLVFCLGSSTTFQSSEGDAATEATAPPAFATQGPVVKEERRVPLTPAIEKEGGGREVPIETEHQPGSPIRLVQGRTHIGQQAYGQGLMTLKNISQKSIYVIRGEFVFSSTVGPVSKSWKLGGTGPLLTGGWKPDDTITIPTGSPLTNLINQPGAELQGASFRVTGAVFSDGTVWGETGESLLESFKVETASLRAVVLSLMDACSKWPARVVEGQLLDGNLRSGIYTDGSTQWYLRKELLDENHHLRPNAMEVLRRMSNMLENPFQQR